MAHIRTIVAACIVLLMFPVVPLASGGTAPAGNTENCGTYAIRQWFYYHRSRVPDELRSRLDEMSSREAISFLEMKVALQSAGVQARVVSMTFDELSAYEGPIIAHLTEGHFVCALPGEKSFILLEKPRRSVTTEWMLNHWSGTALMISIPEDTTASEPAVSKDPAQVEAFSRAADSDRLADEILVEKAAYGSVLHGAQIATESSRNSEATRQTVLRVTLNPAEDRR